MFRRIFHIEGTIMANIRGMSARFVRPDDQQAIERVEKAAKTVTTVSHRPDTYAARIRALHERARAIDAAAVKITGPT
ncbi:hypothetical protein BZM26_36580 [Paraburkholderia strydomiana]|nr:hypothetical protein BZM26_36580 [Paraburkholderia strydomiana]